MVNAQTQRQLRDGTMYNHKNALVRLKQFCEDYHLPLNWRLFDHRFEENFSAWMREKRYRPNTISAQFSIMKVWLNQAEMEHIITDKYFHKWKTTKHEVDNIFLNEDEIQKIYQIDSSSPSIKSLFPPKSHIEQTRDLFVLACWCGLRFGDWSNLSKAVIDDEGITVHTSKTAKTVFIPYFHPLVQEIIEKYNYKLPKSVDKTHVIAHLRHLGKLAGITTAISHTWIEGGNEKTEIVPKYELIGTHTARRSFATNMYLRGNSPLDIMSITGHTTEENFLKYIKLSQRERAMRMRLG